VQQRPTEGRLGPRGPAQVAAAVRLHQQHVGVALDLLPRPGAAYYNRHSLRRFRHQPSLTASLEKREAAQFEVGIQSTWYDSRVVAGAGDKKHKASRAS
jgi:hypothetical protein